MQQLVAAGGVLRLPLRFGKSGPTVRQRAYAAQAKGRLPPGKALTTTVIGDQIELRLINASADERPAIPAPELINVPVSDDPNDLQSLAKRLQGKRERHEVSEAMLPRATILVSAIVREAKRRRWKISVPDGSGVGSLRGQWTPARDGHFSLVAGDGEFTLRISEKGVKTRGKWEWDFKAASRDHLWDRWHSRERPTGPYDAGATGILVIRLDGGRPGLRDHRRSNFGDQQNARLEERLPLIFQEIVGLTRSRGHLSRGMISSERSSCGATSAQEVHAGVQVPHRRADPHVGEADRADLPGA